MAKYTGKSQFEMGVSGGGTGGVGGGGSRGSMASRADARREIADTNNPKGKRMSDRELYQKGMGTKQEREAQNTEAAKKLASRISGGESLDDIFKFKKGGSVKKYAKGGGCELRGKTKGRMV